tara:strand:+ start:703 stop:888 length:186 start_codon:yes stop_codon:yes gene_type:complete
MTKFSRHDPRNKKEGNNKAKSLAKDLRIREVSADDVKQQLNEVMYDDEYDKEEFNNQPLQG